MAYLRTAWRCREHSAGSPRRRRRSIASSPLACKRNKTQCNAIATRRPHPHPHPHRVRHRQRQRHRQIHNNVHFTADAALSGHSGGRKGEAASASRLGSARVPTFQTPPRPRPVPYSRARLKRIRLYRRTLAIGNGEPHDAMRCDAMRSGAARRVRAH